MMIGKFFHAVFVFWRPSSTLLMLAVFFPDLSSSESSYSIKSLGNALHHLLAEGLVPVDALPLLDDDLHSLSCMCSVAPVQKDDTQHQKFLYHLRIQSSILNEMFFEWLLGSECVPLSIVKQMY